MAGTGQRSDSSWEAVVTTVASGDHGLGETLSGVAAGNSTTNADGHLFFLEIGRRRQR
jgi:hypothetical protein